jgi:hypothetical protein
MRAAKARRQSISPEELNAALSTITDFLRTSWTTGGGRRLQHFAFHFSAPVGQMVDSVAGYFAGSGLLHEEVNRDYRKRALGLFGGFRRLFLGCIHIDLLV